MAVILMGGGSPGILPSEVSGLQFWLDAAAGTYSDAGSTPSTNGGVVQQWNDQSGNARHMSSSGGARPTLQSGVVNGYPVVRFDASDDVMSRTSQTYSDYFAVNAKTMFVVIYTANSAHHHRVLNFHDGVRYVTGIETGSANQFQAQNWDGSSDVAAKAQTLASWRILWYTHDGANVSIADNDARAASLTSTASGNSSIGGACDLYLRFPTTPVQVDYAEAAMWNVVLTEDQRKDVERRLAWKYGITLPY